MSERIHAGCVAIGGRGVLLLGPSGTGKSDLALRLLDRGAILVSDDYTELRSECGILVGSPPTSIAGMIEIRAVGIVERPHLAEIGIALAVELGKSPDRLPKRATITWQGVDVPLVALSGLEASAPIKVEAALALHGLTLPCRP